jgi:transposase InsO family protein
LSRPQRRAAVGQVVAAGKASQRRACRELGQARSSQRYVRKAPPGDEAALVTAMRQQVRAEPRYGYRRVAALLRRQGFRANAKRVHRLWKREGFKVPVRQAKRRAVGQSANGIAQSPATAPNDVWTWDFIHDRTANGKALKVLSLVDEHTRECLALVAARSLPAKAALAVFQEAVAGRGAPKRLRSDNGPEFIARALQGWLEQAGVATAYIAPASPWENGFAESFHARLRDEFLNAEVFDDAAHAQALAAAWRRKYNEERPHSSLGYATPSEFARACSASGRKAPVAALPAPSSLRPSTPACGAPGQPATPELS